MQDLTLPAQTRLAFPVDVRKLLRLAAIAAGRAAMPYFRPDATTTARISYKDGGSPVTEADFAANDAIRVVLMDAMPEAAFFSEENDDDGARFDKRSVFVIDPIDGTRAFIQGRNEWCISIALMEAGVPVAGVVFAPARNQMFEAVTGTGAFLNAVRLKPLTAPGNSPSRLAAPHRLLHRIIADHQDMVAADPLRALAYRLTAVAGDDIDAALASGGAQDWDIAAADVILAEVGCSLLTDTGGRPVYNAAKPVHPALIAAHQELVPRLIPYLAG